MGINGFEPKALERSSVAWIGAPPCGKELGGETPEPLVAQVRDSTRDGRIGLVKQEIRGNQS